MYWVCISNLNADLTRKYILYVINGVHIYIGFFLLSSLNTNDPNFNPSMLRNYIYKDEITHPFPNFEGVAA